MTTATMEASTETKAASKVTLPLGSLQTALTKISPAIPGASCTIPVLRTVRIENTEGGTTFTATDLELAIRATLPRAQDAGAPFLVSAERLTGYVKLLEGEEVSIAAGGARATLKCGRSKTQLPLDRIENYPATALGISVDGLTVAQSAMKRMLDYTLFVVSDEESRYILGGGLLETEDGALRLVATDGHRMAIYTVRAGLSVIKPIVLPMGLMKAMGKTLNGEDNLIVRVADEDQIKVEIAGDMPISIASRKLVGQFPNYKQVIPKAGEVEVTVNATELLMSLGRCVAMSDQKSYCVKLTMSPDSIQMKSADPQAGETEESVECQGNSFPKFTTGFNGKYLIEALKRIKGDVKLSFAKADGQNAITVSCEPEEGESFVYVAMPMRV